MRSLLSVKEISREKLLYLLDRAAEVKQHPPPPLLTGKLMASCFFEPSTRTRLSFEAAMHRLGGRVIGFGDASCTSVAKGESLHDTIKIIGSQADLIVMRHPRLGALREAAAATSTPLINAGEGTGEHPTQTLLDLFTIRESLGRLEQIAVACVGDLLHSRTIHSLLSMLCYFGVTLFLVSPPELALAEAQCRELQEAGITYSLHEEIEEVVEKVDILYMTRIQKERFQDGEVYTRLKDRYRLTAEGVRRMAPHAKLLHPLPRLEEIAPEVDQMAQAHYFTQAANGCAVRQALLCEVLL